MARRSVALTIDLDFFFHPVLRATFDTPLKSIRDRQQANSRQSLWIEEQPLSELVSYLRHARRNSCFHCIDKHSNVLEHICDAVLAGRLSKPLTVVNLDGHSDLYFGDADSHYSKANQLQCNQLPSITHEASWVWVLHALGWMDKYVWIKPNPGFLRFALPELPKSFVEAESAEVIDWVQHNLPGYTWADAMYTGNHPELLEKSFQGLKATRFGRSFRIRVCGLEPNALPTVERIGCVTICRSPGFTPAKADGLYERITSDTSPGAGRLERDSLQSCGS